MTDNSPGAPRESLMSFAKHIETSLRLDQAG